MKTRSCKGFTMIELVVALSIAGILMGIGIPSFLSAAKNSKQSSQYQELVSALYIARSEAVKQTSMVTVCARQSDTLCKTGANVDWGDGWIVFVDNSGTGLTDGQIDAGERIMQITADPDSDIEAWAYASGAATYLRQPFIRYDPRGSANWEGGTLKICDDRGAAKALAMNVVLTGDIRKARGDVPIDVNGAAVTC